MSDEEDYLSDKFLVEVAATPPKTYSSLRQEAQKRSHLKNEQNRTKSRRQREIDSREEGLSRSLFERAQGEPHAENKALSIMMKMGFKPGESLGKPTEDDHSSFSEMANTQHEHLPQLIIETHPSQTSVTGNHSSGHKAEPLPLQEWAGKKGIGTLKRPPSPTSRDRMAKMAKMAEDSSRREFRDRASQQYEDKRAATRLLPAQQTCVALDQNKGISFNILWLDPNDPESFPEGLVDALELHTDFDSRAITRTRGDSIEGRLRQQMRADALHPAKECEESLHRSIVPEQQYTTDVLEEAAQFLRLQVRDRLDMILSYLREQYWYCFWCGTQYADEAEMQAACPGIEEELHD